MSTSERYAWASVAVWVGILFFLFARFTTGYEVLGQSLGFVIVEQPPARLLWTYVSVCLIAAVGEAVVMSVLAFGTDGAIERDERDRAINARANLASYWFTASALNVIIIHVLMNAVYGGSILPNIDLMSVTGIAFALLLVLTLAEIVKRAAVIWNYRLA